MALTGDTVKVYDVLIVGGGPSGLACALTLGRVRRSVLVFDSQQYRNARTDRMMAFPTNEGRPPAEYLEMAQREVRQYPSVEFCLSPVAIVAVSKELLPSAVPDSCGHQSDALEVFRVTDGVGRSWIGHFLVLATGVVDVLPSIPGFEENWGRHILHCIYCHGYEHRDQSAGVIGSDFVNVSSALTSTTLFSNITLFSNGGFPRTGLAAETLALRIPNFEALLAARKVRIDHRQIKGLAHVTLTGGVSQSGMEIYFVDGSLTQCDVLLHVPPTAPRSAGLTEQLGLQETTAGNWELLHPAGKTSHDKLYVAGDAGQVFKAVSNAVFTGMAVGTMIHHDLSFLI